ncbi:hypothetical protein CYMTET_8891 [Cymbomonas tetramitiformis]|uniref:RING-type domain-containing protein n=1 Tax=Cymbomonas tetramitiformis TaxID=36881 RepID=A0AAE0GSJ1_9CHLO|nr:hypothetical protein CYMTET_8891 [Cymbomonas tetramitiformis]
MISSAFSGASMAPAPASAISLPPVPQSSTYSDADIRRIEADPFLASRFAYLNQLRQRVDNMHAEASMHNQQVNASLRGSRSGPRGMMHASAPVGERNARSMPLGGSLRRSLGDEGVESDLLALRRSMQEMTMQTRGVFSELRSIQSDQRHLAALASNVERTARDVRLSLNHRDANEAAMMDFERVQQRLTERVGSSAASRLVSDARAQNSVPPPRERRSRPTPPPQPSSMSRMFQRLQAATREPVATETAMQLDMDDIVASSLEGSEQGKAITGAYIADHIEDYAVRVENVGGQIVNASSRVGSSSKGAPFEVEDACCICLDSLCSRGAVLTLGCGHRLHRDCMARWVRGKGACICPYCKQETKAKRSHAENS